MKPASRIGSAKLTCAPAWIRFLTAARAGAPARSAASLRRRWPAKIRSQSPAVESTTWSAPARRSAVRDLVALGRGGLREALRGRAACACRRAPGGRSRGRPATGRRRARAPARAGRRSPPPARRGGRAACCSGASQSRSPRKSETITTRPRWRPTAAAPVSAAPSDVAPAPSLDFAAQLGQQREQAEAALARAHDARVAGAEGEHAEPVAAPRRDVADGERDALGDVGLAAIGGAERHRGGRRRAPARWSAPARRRARARAAPAGARSRSSRCGGRRRPGSTAGSSPARCPEPTCGVRCSPGSRLSIRFITARSSERRTAGGTGPGPGLSGVRSGVGRRRVLTGSLPPRRGRSRRRPAAAPARRRRTPTSPAASPWSWSAACRGCGRRLRAGCASAVAKNWPPVSRAMSCSVSRSGGTRSVFVAPVFGSVCVSVPFWRAERDGVDRDLELLGVLDDVDRVRRRACSRRRRAGRSRAGSRRDAAEAVRHGHAGGVERAA